MKSNQDSSLNDPNWMTSSALWEGGLGPATLNYPAFYRHFPFPPTGHRDISIALWEPGHSPTNLRGTFGPGRDAPLGKKYQDHGEGGAWGCLAVQLEVQAFTSGTFLRVVSVYGNAFEAVFLPVGFIKGAGRALRTVALVGAEF